MTIWAVAHGVVTHGANLHGANRHGADGAPTTTITRALVGNRAASTYHGARDEHAATYSA
ncbi:MAG: hypothetical protein LBH13_08595 [Cellulomonadaceae bacterium]|jgi:hypothetical protein|nr:hypothetical protein [Cellulomonadaceae bacterium]